ncbi:MAG TPA: hypothetical protein DDW51_12285 [Cyanobacteria bacterium UBA11367]|nr:hypothetical protein [Cyanobacteria bacterium UBA11367]
MLVSDGVSNIFVRDGALSSVKHFRCEVAMSEVGADTEVGVSNLGEITFCCEGAIALLEVGIASISLEIVEDVAAESSFSCATVSGCDAEISAVIEVSVVSILG